MSDEHHAYCALLMQRFSEAPVVAHLKQRMVRLHDGECEIVMDYSPDHNHGGGAVHGGILMALLDNAAYFAAASVSGGRWVATAEMSTHMLESVREREVRAEGRVLRRGKHMIHAEARAFVRESPARPIATATGVWAVLPRNYR